MLIRRIPTEKQIEASRANGRKSQGPKTPDGKIESAAPNGGHRALINTVLLEGEAAERFSQLLDSLHAELLPDSPIEIQLVESMAVARWRQMRLWALEKATIVAELAKPGSAFSNDAAPIDRTVEACQNLVNRSKWTEHMKRDEARDERLYNRAMSLFHKHRAWRREEIKKSSVSLMID
ncbi:MAG: hypothetical protein ABJC09_11585 [Terriglobia bacterium]